MLKQTILWFLLFSSIHLFAQGVFFEPIFINQTTKEVDTLVVFGVQNQNNNIIAIKKSSDIVELPDTGRYELSIIMSGASYGIYADKYGSLLDTFYTPLVFENIERGSSLSARRYYYYNNEDIVCDSFITDFYYNGNIRLTGRFTNGYPIDTIKQYYENGTLKHLDYYYHKKIIQINQPFPYREYYHWEKHFDREGRLVWESDNKTGKTIRYYPNGNRKFIEFDYANRFEEYYENGNLKYISNNKSKKEYREDGSLMYKYNKKSMKEYPKKKKD